MRTSSFAAKVVISAASLALLGAAPATAASAGAQGAQSTTQLPEVSAATGYHSTYNSKFACQYQAAIASSRGYGVECRAVRDGAYRTKWQLWIVDEWKYW